MRPAFAGEGRYFVRVPEGTNKNRFAFDDGNLKEQASLGEEYHTPLALNPCSTGSTCCSMLAHSPAAHLPEVVAQPTLKTEASLVEAHSSMAASLLSERTRGQGL